MSQSMNSMPAELYGGPLASLPEIQTLLRETVRKNPTVEAVVSLHQKPLNLPELDEKQTDSALRWTYGQLFKGATHLATKFEALGVRKGSAIVLFSENRAEWVLLCWTSVLLRCPFVPLNPRLASNATEMKFVLNQIRPSVITVPNDNVRLSLQANTAQESSTACLLISLEEIGTPPVMPEQGARWTSLADLWYTTTPQNQTWDGKVFADTTIIGFTSGTTSLPKACPQSSDNLMVSALAVRELRKIGSNDRLCQHLPGFAAMAVLINLTYFVSGATIVYPSPSFSPAATLDAIEKERCTYTFAAPAIIKALAMHPNIRQKSLKSLHTVELGGAPIYPEILQLATTKDGLDCERVGCGWGMTESPCPLLAEPWNRKMVLPSDYIAVGKPIKGTWAKICAPESSQPVRIGEEGELHVGGPQVVRGYLNSNNEAFYEENGVRWIRTGDMARIKDGEVYIVGRYKDIIIRGGHNISPAKIERCLEKIKGAEVQVVGIPDDLAGEVPVAVVKFSEAANVNPEDIISKLRYQSMKDLGPVETPDAFVTLGRLGLDSFPTTLSGKIQKAKLAGTVQRYLAGSKIQNRALAQDSSTVDVLKELWSRVAGVPVSLISDQKSVTSFADSITIMRFSTLVKRQLYKDLTVEDVISYPTVQGQAAILDSRQSSTANGLLNARRDPPTTIDMIHCKGSQEKATLTETIATAFLKNLGLSWSDVEDVFPATDTSFIYLNRQRPQTWNQRVIYLAPNTDVHKLTATWKAILIHHPMFRTVAVSTVPTGTAFASTKHLFVVLRPNDAYWNCSITTNLEVDTPEDLRSTFLNEWADSLSGPLVRIAFVSIKSTNSSAFILVGNHAAYDNLSMDLLFTDLETALVHNLTAENILTAPGHVPYKRFADTYFNFRSSDEALQSATFHAERLRGIGALRDSLWPKSRAPGWFKGPDENWTVSDGTPGNPSLRTPIDPPQHRHGLDGLTRTVPVKTLRQMKDTHGIMPHVILKAAVALFNMRKTGTTSALFANVEAGRRWPCSPPSPQSSPAHDTRHTQPNDPPNPNPNPNPLSIAGPMFQVVLNLITLSSSSEPVLSLLTRIQSEQNLLSAHSQAPLFLIHSLLHESNTSDSAVFFDALARQGYNWAPGVQTSPPKQGESETEVATPTPTLVKFNRIALDDIGLAWTCGARSSADLDTFYVNASYDDCQLSKDEVFGFIGEVLRGAVWLAEMGNLGRGVDECAFEGEGVRVSGLIDSLE